jgi:Uma2 family endonuclease
METLPGQIRRPDVGIDCGRRDPNGYKAAEPRMVLEVLSPGTRDFDTFEKLGEYKTVESLAHVVFVDPDCAEVVHWRREPDRRWERRLVEDLDGTLDLVDLSVTLPLREIYDGVTFPPSLRPRLVDDR